MDLFRFQDKYGDSPKLLNTLHHTFLPDFFFFLFFMHLCHKILGGISNIVDPDQIAPEV